ncbi:MAG: class I SAM-dependent methyltransferase [Thermodesulfobacteriota bacterium]
MIRDIIGKIKKVSFEDDDLISLLKKKYPHKERRFYYGNKRYAADTLDCHAAPGTVEVSLLLLADMLQKNSGNNKMLNLGGGTGHVSGILQELGFDVVNSDIGIEKEDKRNVRFDLNGDSQLPFASETFDFIMCQEVIEHIENPWKLFRTANRVLKKGGFLFLTTPNILSERSKKIFDKTGYFHWFTPKNLAYHINPMPYWEIEHIAGKTGFALKELRGNAEYFFGKGEGFPKSRIIAKSECLIFIMAKEG